MTTVSKWEFSAPRVIAHRGASAYTPENTLAAFRKAVEMKADAIELDAKLLKDGTIIVHHDKTLKRTTNGEGSVYQYSYQELRSLDAGSHFSSDYSHEKIPTLAEVLSEFGNKININIELTNYHRPWDKLVINTIELVKKYHLEESILFSSFNPWALVQAKWIEPTIARALLLDYGSPRLLRSFFQFIVECRILHPQFSLFTNKDARLKSDYLHINVWTINDPQRIQEAIALGVSGIITDKPDIAIEVWNDLSK